MKKGLVYVRVSSDEQAKEGQSLETQEKICQKAASEADYRIVSVYSDPGRSGLSLKGRIGLEDLIAKCEEGGIEAVFVQDTDRLARNPLDHFTIKATLKKLGVQVISVSQPMIDDSPEGNLVDGILAQINAFQSQITGRKTSKVLEQKVLAGFWPGWSPLGYKNVRNPNPHNGFDKNIVVPDQDTAPFIAMLFDLFSTSRYSVDSLVDILYKRGLRSKTGQKPYRSIIYETLKNPFYVGKIRYKGQIFEGKHKALTTPEKFELCQRILEEHNRFANRRRKHFWLLAGLAYCATCEHRLVAEHHPAKAKSYYHCIKLNVCKDRNIEVGYLESLVAKELKKVEFDKSFIERVRRKVIEYLSNSQGILGGEKRTLLNRKLKIEEDRNILERKLLAGTVNDSTYKRLHDELDSEIDSLDEEIEKLDNRKQVDTNALSEVLGLCVNLSKTYSEASERLQKHYLHLFFSRIWVQQRSIISTEFSPLFAALIEDKEVILSRNWLALVNYVGTFYKQQPHRLTTLVS